MTSYTGREDMKYIFDLIDIGAKNLAQILIAITPEEERARISGLKISMLVHAQIKRYFPDASETSFLSDNGCGGIYNCGGNIKISINEVPRGEKMVLDFTSVPETHPIYKSLKDLSESFGGKQENE